MELRSKNKQANFTNVHSLSHELENPYEEATKMAHGHAAEPPADIALVLKEIRAGNQALSDKMETRTVEINESISGLKPMLDGLTSRVTEAEDELANMDTQLAKLTKDNMFLLDKVESLENHSRCNNIRIVNLREGCEDNDPVAFFTNWLPNVLGREHFSEPLMIERVHRTLAPRPPTEGRPRPLLIRLLR